MCDNVNKNFEVDDDGEKRNSMDNRIGDKLE
jgi:hypothetical protein